MGLAMGHGVEGRLKYLGVAAGRADRGRGLGDVSDLDAGGARTPQLLKKAMMSKSTLFSLALAGLIGLLSMAPVSPSHPTGVGPVSYLAEIGSHDPSRMSLRPPVSRIDDAQCGPWLTCGEGTTCCPNDGTQPWDCEPPGKACPGQ
jgi:hypothetical protein